MAKNVLIVDDDVTSLELYKAFFRTKDYHVLTAANGREALERLQKDKVHLIILDLVMPEMSGEEVMEAMLQHPEWKKIPIVIDTVFNEFSERLMEIKKRYEHKLQYAFFQKPAAPEKLADAIHAILAL